MIFSIEKSLDLVYENIIKKVEEYGPKVIGAIIIIFIGAIISRLLYLFLMFLFKKLKLNEFVDKLKISFDEETLLEEIGIDLNKKKSKKEIKKIRFTDKIKVDNVVAKSVSYYLLIIFFRISISYIGITEIEKFLKDLTYYLPNLFVGIMIGFFGIRFANFIYDVVYHTLNVTREKTSKIVASGAKILILFFTLMVFLDYTQVVSIFIINTILIGFISMLALAGGLAFGLGGKDVAHEILESFRK